MLLICFHAGLKQGRSPSGTKCLQEETWLCSGHLWRLLRGVSAFHAAHSHVNLHKEIFSCRSNCICLYAVLQVCLRYYEHEFVELACQCPAVVCCRCSPTQKAQIVTLLQQHTANRTCAIGKSWMWQRFYECVRLLHAVKWCITILFQIHNYMMHVTTNVHMVIVRTW